MPTSILTSSFPQKPWYIVNSPSEQMLKINLRDLKVTWGRLHRTVYLWLLTVLGGLHSECVCNCFPQPALTSPSSANHTRMRDSFSDGRAETSQSPSLSSQKAHSGIYKLWQMTEGFPSREKKFWTNQMLLH